MIISDTAIKKRVTVVCLAVLIAIIGLYCYFALPRESSPDITIPFVFISTPYRGVAPPDIETSITVPIEEKLTGLENVKKITSVSSEGLSLISIEFTTGTDITEVLQKVKDKVDEANQDLPTDLEDDPIVSEVNFSDFPIVIYALSGPVGPARLKVMADDLSDAIEAIPGVLEAEVTGGIEREIRVEFLPERLAYYGVSSLELENTLRQENQNVSGGVMRMADGRFQLQTPGELKTPQDFFQLVVGNKNGKPVYLIDVANVYDGYKEETSRSRLDGHPAVTIQVKKRSGENIIKIGEQVDALIAKEKAQWPQGTEITKLMDEAKNINNMVADLENNLISGLILVLLILPLALGLRNAILVGISIPFSMFLSFMVLYFMGITLNLVVLFSLTLALGMLVDNAIVIIENIYRFTSQGVPRIQAAMRATSEVAYPVIGSTLTTIAAFFPMIFWPGIMGEFMKYLPMTLIITLTSSLFVAMVINPALASIFLKQSKANSTDIGTEDVEAIIKAGEQPANTDGPILSRYKNLLETVLRHRLTVIFISFGVLILIIQLWLLRIGIEKPVEFFPAIDPANIYVNLDMPEGADLELSDRIVKQVEMAVADSLYGTTSREKYINIDAYNQALATKEHHRLDGSPYPSVSDLQDIRNMYSNAVALTGGGSDIFSANTPNHIGIQFLDFHERPVPSPEIVDAIRERVIHIPGAKITVAEQEHGPPTGAPINIEISGDAFPVLGQIAKNIKNIIARSPYAQDIRDDYVEGTPTIRLLVDKQKASLGGLSASLIGQALKNAYNGLDVSTYREKDEEFDITIQLPESYRKNTDTLKNLLIATPQGNLIPLSTIAKFEYTGSLGRIVRINNERVVTVKANVNEDMIPGPVARAEAEKALQKFDLPPGYTVKFTGEEEHQKESEEFLTKAFLVALFLVTLLLISQFNSVGQSFIIMTSVILSLGGAFLGMTLFKMSFGIIMTGVGIISLAGVVVNNGIVLIDYTNQLRQRGMSVHDAVIAAGCTRLRPVLLTAITTILGLIPMVTGISYDFHSWQFSWSSESSQWWYSMAMAVIFGLLFATALTLLVVPALYSLIESAKQAAPEYWQRLHEAYWRLYDRIFE